MFHWLRVLAPSKENIAATPDLALGSGLAGPPTYINLRQSPIYTFASFYAVREGVFLITPLSAVSRASLAFELLNKLHAPSHGFSRRTLAIYSAIAGVEGIFWLLPVLETQPPKAFRETTRTRCWYMFRGLETFARGPYRGTYSWDFVLQNEKALRHIFPGWARVAEGPGGLHGARNRLGNRGSEGLL